MRIGARFAVGLCAAATLGLFAGTAVAQASAERGVLNAAAALDQLRDEQARLFSALIDRPDDLDLMFEYAIVSIRLEDYEAAISTLERMLIYRTDLPRVRLELAVAYFNLGSYEAARLYFQQVLDQESTPEDVRARVGRYMAAIEERTKTSALTGVLSAGITYASNATLGPEDNQAVVSIAGNPTVFDVSNGREEGDFGARTVLSLTHVYDLQQEDSDVWRTDFTAYAVHYFNTEEGNVEFLRLRTGPRLSLDNQQFGPKLRPYAEAQYLSVDGTGLFASGGMGIELTDTISPLLSFYSDGGIRYREYFDTDFDDEDSLNVYAAAGIAYIPMRDLVLRGTVLAETDLASASFNSNVEGGLRLSAEYQYSPGIDFVDSKWSVSAFGEVRYRSFSEPDPTIDPNTERADVDLRAGFSHVFAIKGGFGVQLDVDALLRRSNILNFDLSNVSATLSAQYRF